MELTQTQLKIIGGMFLAIVISLIMIWGLATERKHIMSRDKITDLGRFESLHRDQDSDYDSSYILVTSKAEYRFRTYSSILLMKRTTVELVGQQHCDVHYFSKEIKNCRTKTVICVNDRRNCFSATPY